MDTIEARSYWIREPGVGELRTEQIAAIPAKGESLIQTEWSAVSPGTERLVGLGQVPSSCNQELACRYMQGSFELPLKYGYCSIGRGVEGALAGKQLFVMHPHQTIFAVRDQDVTLLPEDLPGQRAALIPNLETALNAVWDAELVEGEVSSVFGAGSVGLLVAYVLWRKFGRAPRIVERDGARREFVARLPWGTNVTEVGENLQGEVKVCFHTTGNPDGLGAALAEVGFEGRVIELSWYGNKRVSLELGTHFHYGRKRIIASQVGQIAVSHRQSHGYGDRIDEVLKLLDQPELDLLLGTPIPFGEMPGLMSALYRGETTAPLPLIDYQSQ